MDDPGFCVEGWWLETGSWMSGADRLVCKEKGLNVLCI